MTAEGCWGGNRRGASLVLVAISLIVVMLMAALAIDLGRLLTERAEAQRAADAAALAGASAFTEGDDNAAQGEAAITRAKDLASRNAMGGTPIDISDVGDCGTGPPLPYDDTRDPPPDRTALTCELAILVWYPTDTSFARVRVRVRRAEVPIWFARVIGKRSWPVGARAAAVAGGAATAQCVMPVVFPDFWYENNTDDGNHWPEDSERWAWNDVESRPDCYWKYGAAGPDPTDPSAEHCSAPTGLGSDLRNDLVVDGKQYYRDVGRPMVIKPRGGTAPYAPSYYDLWDIPGSNKGASDIAASIRLCDPDRRVSLGPQGYENKPGAAQGPVRNAFKDRIAQYDSTGAVWEVTSVGGYTGGQVKVTRGDWRKSPKVILVPLAHPKFVAQGRIGVEFNTFAYFWLEDAGRDIVARFIGPETGGLGGPTEGRLLMKVTLVE